LLKKSLLAKQEQPLGENHPQLKALIAAVEI